MCSSQVPRRRTTRAAPSSRTARVGMPGLAAAGNSGTKIAATPAALHRIHWPRQVLGTDSSVSVSIPGPQTAFPKLPVRCVHSERHPTERYAACLLAPGRSRRLRFDICLRYRAPSFTVFHRAQARVCVYSVWRLASASFSSPRDANVGSSRLASVSPSPARRSPASPDTDVETWRPSNLRTGRC